MYEKVPQRCSSSFTEVTAAARKVWSTRKKVEHEEDGGAPVNGWSTRKKVEHEEDGGAPVNGWSKQRRAEEREKNRVIF